MIERGNKTVSGSSVTDKWRPWEQERAYGELFCKRAKGEMPEMESSKAAATILKSWVREGDSILDVGCGAGHYLRSIRNQIQEPFSYKGVDATAYYIELGRAAWKEEKSVEFQVADVFDLPFGCAEFDVVMSCNLLLHLPSVKKPLQEIIRVAKRRALIRTLVGDRSFRIQDVYSPETHPERFDSSDAEEFDEAGEPKAFHFYNIYSRSCITNLLKHEPRIKSFSIVPDVDFDVEKLTREADVRSNVPDITRIVGGWQVNGYVLQPWHFIQVELR